MQVFQWLSKKAQQPLKIVTNSCPTTQKQDLEDQKVKSKNIVKGVRKRHLKRVEQSKFCCKNLSIFSFLQRKDVSKTRFYYTLNLRRIGSFHRSQMKMKQKETRFSHVCDSTTHSGNKVLPITDSAQTSSRNTNDQCLDLDKKNRTKSVKTKGVSRMKELVKWVATSKGEKGEKQKIGRKVLHFKTSVNLKIVQDEDQLTNDSPKISFSCSIDSSLCSVDSKASSLKHDQILSTEILNFTRTGNWITTDSEFVVLEL